MRSRVSRGAALRRLAASRAPGVGLEPTTFRLTAGRICQIELPRNELSRTDLDRLGPRQCSDSGLDFSVAVRAQQHAFPCLFERAVQGAGDAPVGNRERLGGRLDVMELQRDERAVIA